MKLFNQIEFLQYATEPSFVAWFITQLKPVFFDKDEIVFKKGERVVEVLFMCNGKAVTETGVISGGTSSIIGFKRPTEIFYPGSVLGLYKTNNAMLMANFHQSQVRASLPCDMYAFASSSVNYMKMHYPGEYALLIDSKD